MRQYLLLLLFLFSFTAIFAENDPNQWLANQKISFTENKGQIADKGKVRKDILFMVQGKGVKVYFTKKGLIYNYIQTEETFFKKPKDKQEEDKIRKEHPEQIIRKGKAYGMELLFENASENMTIRSEEETGETSNYYLPHCPDGITGVKSYEKIMYENIYENIDLVFYSNQQGLKYDFIVKPGGKVEDIKLRYKDIDKIKLLNNGNLEITNPLGKLTEEKPFSYQNNKQEVKSSYKLKGRAISFQIDNYDKSRNLIIDPSIVWSTYYGGIGYDSGNAVTTDKDGNVYLAGYTISGGLASGGFKNTNSNTFAIGDAFLVKFSSSGQRLWATYYGGANDDIGNTVITDASGNVYLAGLTKSASGIASGGFQNTLSVVAYGEGDAFLVKFSSSGQRLWATYYGGNAYDNGYALTTDVSGNVYLAGETASTGMASGGFQNTLTGSSDAFLVKFSSSGQRLWATYYGEFDFDRGRSLISDISGNIYLTGETASSTGISSNGFQNENGGGYDAFLAKFSSSGQRLWATYYGGEADDYGTALTIDMTGSIYIAGNTKSTTSIASLGFQNTIGGFDDAFLVKFSSSGQRLWATYYGRAGNDSGKGVSIDMSGNVYLAGYAYNAAGIASGGFQNTPIGGYDVFLVKFNSSGQRLWATYYGGKADDYGRALTIDMSGNIYIAGYTYSPTGIASESFQSTIGGLEDMFLVKISENIPSNIISGTIYQDLNGNCVKDVGEKAIPNIVVKAEPNGYGISDSFGNYSIQVGVGTYTVKQVVSVNTFGRIITQVCPVSDYTVQFMSLGDTIRGKDFGNQVALCPYLETYISSNRRRRCFLNTTTVSYANTGFAKAENVKVYVKMPEYVVLKKADKTFTRDSEGNYVFSIGSLDANQSGVINIQDSVVCKSGITGLTACTKVWITPSNNCKAPSSNWDKSDIVLSGKCIDNGRIRFVLKNIGEGNMADSSQMRLYLNASLALKKGFKLNKGDSLILSIPANGKTVRLEADQRVDHPRKSSSNITFEGCVANLSEVVSKGFVNQFPQDDTEPEVSVSCLPIVDSFDPNDKGVEPEGTTANHYTPTDAELKYLIRFQNTGTDTAYTVTVIDTLSENLDIATLQLGSSSHKYSFNLSGKGRPVLTWTFNKINLPDSTKNKLGSNGFVAFSIKPKTGLAEKTKIENYADIIFDFNDPVRTNTTFNSIYDVPLTIDNSVKLDEKTVIIPKPTITSFTPQTGVPGDKVTISGTGFEMVKANNTVKFGDIVAEVITASATTLEVKVPGGFYQAKLSVTTQAGTAISTASFTMSPNAAETFAENEIKIYPNPTTGRFTIDFSEAKFVVKEIEILNGKGQKVYFLKTDKKQKAEITLMNSGLYFIHIKTNNLNIIRKLVVQ